MKRCPTSKHLDVFNDILDALLLQAFLWIRLKSINPKEIGNKIK